LPYEKAHGGVCGPFRYAHLADRCPRRGRGDR
jgi:hypothetical protein